MAIAGLCGAAMAIAVTLVLQRDSSEAQGAPRAVPSSASTSGNDETVEIGKRKLWALQRPFDRSEEGLQNQSNPADPGAATTGEPASGNPVDKPLDGNLEHQRRIDSHWQEPLDSAWSASTETTISDELTAFADKSGFTLENVRCRSKSCLAELKWANYSEARSHWADVIQHRYEKSNCAREVFIPETAEPDRPYSATVVFECR
jgi:hypothetical protein